MGVWHWEVSGTEATSKTPNVPNEAQANYALAAAKGISGTKGALTQADAPSLWTQFKSFVSENLPTIVEGAKTIGGLAVAAITRNPQVAAFALSGLGNMIKGSGQEAPRLTDRQKSILHAEKQTTVGYFTPFDLIYQDLFDWIPAPISVVDANSTLNFIPRPNLIKMGFKISPDILGTITAEGSIVDSYYNINNILTSYPTGMSSGSYDACILEAQIALDVYLGQTPPESADVRNQRLADEQEKQELKQVYLNVTSQGWKILGREGNKAFLAFLIVTQGERAAEIHSKHWAKNPNAAKDLPINYKL